MPLEPFKRGETWYARGRVEYNGRPITDYIRESTGASSESGARDWINEREDREIRRHVVGEEHVFTFQDAVMLYKADKMMARYLIPLLKELGNIPVRKITPQQIKNLGPKLYPSNSTDTWRRWVVTPARRVINNANKLRPDVCPPIRIEGYSKAERIKQDTQRGKQSRVPKVPGDWEWVLRFRSKASKRHGAAALLMFMTGARIGQVVDMRPAHVKRLDEGIIIIPAAKGHAERELVIPKELMLALQAITPTTPRGWPRKPENLRVFGWASRTGPLSGWRTACKEAKIPYLPPHSSGRHGFGQEMRVRQKVDKKAVESFGGWSPEGDMVDRTYTHAEAAEGKIHKALRTGRVQAEKRTGIKLLKENA